MSQAKPKTEEANSETQAEADIEAKLDAADRLNEPGEELEPVAGTDLASAAPVFDLAVPGMEGLELGFGSIPLIKLDKGEFICSEFELEDSFDVVLLSAKAKYFYKCSDENHAIPFFYTYDHKETTNGEAVSDILEMWHVEDNTYSPPSKYLEVLVRLIELDQFAMLSISPKSIGRYTKYVSLDLAHAKKRTPQDVITKVKVGPRIESRFPFRPWDFEYGGDLAA